MMSDFIRAALETFEDCNENVRECLRQIVVRGFALVPVTPTFRKVIAEAYGVEFETVETMGQNELVRLGLLVISEPEVSDAYKGHAEMVDQYWSLLLMGEAV